METLSVNGNLFRVKKMNAIEVLAFQTQMRVTDEKKAENFFNLILEHLEVQCGNDWLPVKERGKDIYYPAGIENDVTTVQELVSFFLNDYLMPIFLKSNESNE